MAGDEGEQPEVPFGVARDHVVKLEVESREITMVILKSLAHQDRAILGLDRELITGLDRRLETCLAAVRV